MATEHSIYSETFKAEADLSAKQYFGVKFGSAAPGIVLASSAGERIVGILQEGTANGDYGAVAMMGFTKAKIGGNVTWGAPLQVDADGMLIAAATGDFVVGYAFGAGADGDIITVFLVPNVPYDA